MTDRCLSGCCFLIVAWLVMTVAAYSDGACRDHWDCSRFTESHCSTTPWLKKSCKKMCKLCPEPPTRMPDPASTPPPTSTHTADSDEACRDHWDCSRFTESHCSTTPLLKKSCKKMCKLCPEPPTRTPDPASTPPSTSTHTAEPPSDSSSSWQMSVLAAGVAVLVVILIVACIVVVLFRLRKQKQKIRHARPLQRNARNASGDPGNDEAPLTIQAPSRELCAIVIKPGSQPTARGQGAKKPSTKPKDKRKPSTTKRAVGRTIEAGGGGKAGLRSQVNQDGLVYTSVDFSQFKADPEKSLPATEITEYVAINFRQSG